MKSLCPNINSPEWRALESKVGRFEAMRDWLETNGEIRSPKVVLDKLKITEEKPRITIPEVLYGATVDDNLNFHVNTINKVTEFLEGLNVDVKLVKEILNENGTPVESAVAVANFMKSTVEIVDDLEKRPEAWNKLPEEAAHWWYRLLETNSPLKKLLWESAQTANKLDELTKGEYSKLGFGPDALKEEAIGQLIAEAIKRIEVGSGSPKDYSFFKAFLKWVNKLLNEFATLSSKHDPFEVAAIKILTGDYSDLLTLDEYLYLTSKAQGTILTKESIEKKEVLNRIEEEEIADEKYILDSLKKRSRYLKKTIESAISTSRGKSVLEEFTTYDTFGKLSSGFLNKGRDIMISMNSTTFGGYSHGNQIFPIKKIDSITDTITKANEANVGGTKLVEKVSKEKALETFNKQFIKDFGIVSSNIDFSITTPVLKNFGDILKKYRKQPININEPFKVDGVNKKELYIYNYVLYLIRSENPKLKSITAEAFINEVVAYLEAEKTLLYAEENFHDTYRLSLIFKITNSDPRPPASPNVQSIINQGEAADQAMINRLTSDERNELLEIMGLKNYTGDVKHNKITVRSFTKKLNPKALRTLDNTFHEYSHFSDWPVSTFGNLTDFYSYDQSAQGDIIKNATLLHEIQTNPYEALRDYLKDNDLLDGDIISKKNILKKLKDIKSDLVKLANSQLNKEKIIDSLRDVNFDISLMNIINRELQKISTSNPKHLLYDIFNGIILYLSSNEYTINRGDFYRNLTPLDYNRIVIKKDYIKGRYDEFLEKINEKINLWESGGREQNQIALNLTFKHLDTLYTDKNRLNSIQDTISELIKPYEAFYKREIDKLNADDFAVPFSEKRSHIIHEIKPHLLPLIKTIADKYGATEEFVKRALFSIPTVLPSGRSGSKFALETRQGKSNKLHSSLKYIMHRAIKFNIQEYSKFINNTKTTIFQHKAKHATALNNIKFSKMSFNMFNTLLLNRIDNINLLKSEIAKHLLYKKKNAENIPADKLVKVNEFLDISKKEIDDKINDINVLTTAIEDLELDDKGKLDFNEVAQEHLDHVIPLVHYLIQKHINTKGKNFPLYFSGKEITNLAQGAKKSAMLYAGPEELIKGADEKIGPLYKIVSKLAGVKLIYEPDIPGFTQKVGGYRVDLSNYNYKVPLLYALSKKQSVEPAKKTASFSRSNQNLEHYKDTLFEYLDQNYDINQYGVITDKLSLNDMDAINNKIASMYVPDGWRVVQAKSGNFYIAGHRNMNVFSDEYFTQQGRGAFSRPDIDPNSASQLGILEIYFPEAVTDPSGVNKANEVAKKLADRLSSQTSISYDFISAEQAQELTKDLTTKWNGEPAFFFNGKVYFVGSGLTTATAFHEFSHPIIKYLSTSNSLLFNKLFNELQATDEGKAIIEFVKRNYPEYSDKSDQFKEEAIVKALELKAVNKVINNSVLDKLINKVLYHIKQLLRKLFGRSITVSKLKAETTLNDFANMLVSGGQFNIETEAVNAEDAAEYTRSQVKMHTEDRSEEMKTLHGIDKNDIISLTNRFYDFASRELDMVVKNKDYEGMLRILADEYNRGDLQEIKANLSKFTKKFEKRMAELKDEVKYVQNHVEALVNSYFRLASMMEHMQKHIETLAADKNNIDNIRQAYSYQKLLTYWQEFVKEGKDILIKNGVPASNPLMRLIGRIGDSSRAIETSISKIFGDGIRAVLTSVLDPVAKAVEERFRSNIEVYEKHNSSPKLIDRQYVEYHGLNRSDYNTLKDLELQLKKGPLSLNDKQKYEVLKKQSLTGLKITPEKIDKLLKGEAGDSNVISGMFEGYLYNADPIVGGFALYVKQNLDDMLIKYQRQYNEFSKSLFDSLKEAGYSPSNIGELGEKMGFVDIIGYNDQNGDFKEKKIWALLNPWKNYRFKKDNLQDQVDRALINFTKTNSDKDKAILKNAIKERDEFEKNYMYQKYTKDYYKLQDIFNGPIGQEAKFQRQVILDRIQSTYLAQGSEMEMFKSYAQIDALWEDYSKLYSLYDDKGKLKSDYDKDGNLKKPEDQAYSIALKLQEYRKESAKYYETVPRTGLFENALAKFEQGLVSKGGSAEDIKIERDLWIKRNTKYKIKKEFYDQKKRILDRLKVLQSKVAKDDDTVRRLTEAYTAIDNIMAGFKDEDNQPDGTRINVDRTKAIKEHQQTIVDIYDSVETSSGLSKADYRRLSELYANIKGGYGTEADRNEIDEINSKKTNLLSSLEKAEMVGLFKQLRDLQYRQATPYYVSTVNRFLEKIDNPRVYELLNQDIFEADIADELLRPEVLYHLMKDPEFKTWFDANHVHKKVYNKAEGAQVEVYERLRSWDTIRPVDNKYVETYELKNADGTTELLYAIPATRFEFRRVKNEFRTGYNPLTKKVELKVGEHIDNRGQFLPTPDGIDNTYRNENYYALKARDPKLFKVLEIMTKEFLKIQENAPAASKLYLDFPRYLKSNLEAIQTKDIEETEKKESFWSELVRALKRFWYGDNTMPETGFNFTKDDFVLVRTDLLHNKISSVPIHGLYNLDISSTSTDVTNGILRYMLSLERQKKLIEINPTAHAIKNVLQTNQLKDLNRVDKEKFLHTGEITYETKKGKYNRLQAIEAFIEREFEGKTTTGPLSDNKRVHNMSRFIFKGASFAFFALNIPSALKNSMSQKYQAFIEAIAGKYYNLKDGARGEAWAFKTMGDISFELYNKGPKSLNVQMTELWDPVEGRLETKAHKEGMSRTLLKDSASFSWMYNFRKWVELQSSIQVFGAMLYGAKAELKDGTEINWIDAFELVDGNIHLKSSVKPEYGVTYSEGGKEVVGEKFRQKRMEIQAVMRKLNGAYDRFNQPDAQRWILFRYFSFLRRYFTTMIIDRFAFSGSPVKPRARLDFGLGNAAEGWYISFFRYLGDFFREGPRRFTYATPDERRAILKTLSDGAGLAMLVFLQQLLFGWDPDDPDRYNKLKAKSGPLPFMPGVVNDPDRPFHLDGWLENHALNLLQQVKGENQQFIPLPGLGAANFMQLIHGGSAAFGPTLKTYNDILFDLSSMAMGSDKAYYKKDVGPYSWQQKDGYKIAAHMAKALGYTGSTTDPVPYIRNFQSIQSRQ